MIQSLARFFISGGLFMWPILVVLAFAMAVVVERFYFYFRVCGRKGLPSAPDLIRLMNNNDIEGASKALEKGRDPLTNLLKSAVSRVKAGMTVAEVEEGVQESAIRELPRMNERLNYLSLFANIATLLGLLGTLAGLQSSFSSLAAVEASKKATLLAQGIAEAMNCTAFGLIVAVPCMICYTFFYNRQNALTKDLDESLVRFMNYLRKKQA
ncbi:MAG: hypothetical protein A2293_13000 [Elusimicrobia bacterium RIFOXYB2_FULL_49_7]|nr:MAG: hypothetical protein A2293_13000 [Elusimicrobia bacterium RIFOXYB2_FULL_49_7]